MRRRSRLVSLLCAVAMVCAITPMAAQLAVAGTTVSVKIAVAAPLSGGSATLGQAMQHGAELAVAEYASQLASAGVTVAVSPQDDQGSPSTAVTVANAVVADTSVLGVVGHLNSGCSVPASKIYHTADLAMITPMSAAPVLTQQGLDNVFRACGVDTGQGTLGADVAVKNLRLKRAYVVDDSTDYGRVQLANGFAKRFVTNGGSVAGRAHTLRNQTNFRTVAAKIKAAKPTVVYYGGTYNAGAYLLRRLRSIGVKCQFVGGSGLYDSAFVSTAGGANAERVLATSVGLPNDQLYGGVAYESRFASAFPGVASIDGDDAYAYDATVAIIKSILGVVHDSGTSALSNSGARDRVRAKIAATDFYGVTGRVRFGSTGDRVSPQFSAWRVKSGAWLETAIIGKPEVSKSYEARRVDVLGSLSPRLPTDSHTVRLLFYRKAGSKYVLAKTVTAGLAGNPSASHCTYEAFNVRLAKGSYHVLARQSGNGLATMDSAVRLFTVK
jgi:branched-chain amino acid transport system substrate-binding protein